jgi:hypothetical protein
VTPVLPLTRMTLACSLNTGLNSSKGHFKGHWDESFIHVGLFRHRKCTGFFGRNDIGRSLAILLAAHACKIQIIRVNGCSSIVDFYISINLN